MKKNTNNISKTGHNGFLEAVGPRRPLRKPPRRPKPTSKRTSNKPTKSPDSSKPPKK